MAGRLGEIPDETKVISDYKANHDEVKLHYLEIFVVARVVVFVILIVFCY